MKIYTTLYSLVANDTGRRYDPNYSALVDYHHKSSVRQVVRPLGWFVSRQSARIIFTLSQQQQ